MKARCIQHSEIAKCSPCTREVWDWLLMNARYEDQKHGSFVIKRGQILTRYKDIIEDLSWYVGFAKKAYSEDAMKTAMKTLRKHSMITSMKTRGGMLITICNYNTYQDPKSYEATNEATNENPMKTPRSPQGTPDIIKEGKEENKKEQYSTEILDFVDAFQKYALELHGSGAPKITKASRRSSADSVEKLIRIDKWNIETIKDVMRWAVKDDFWSKNARSLSPLRRKSDNDMSKFANIHAAWKKDSGGGEGDSGMDYLKRVMRGEA